MTRLQVTTPEALPEETSADAALRPSRLDEFVGQSQVKASLQIAIDAARASGGTRWTTRLFFGPPGLGKTTLAMLMAREMGVQLRTTSGPVLEKPGDLVGLLTSLKAGDMLFIDEIHRMKPALEEFLYSAMEDFRIDVRIGDGPNAQTIPMTLEKFTLIGATTRFGLLTPPMRARFGIVERLGFYPPDDLQRIVTRSAGILGVPIEVEGAAEIARRSRGTPRVANRLLRRVRDYAEVKADGRITGGSRGCGAGQAQRGRVRAGRHGCPDPHHHHREVRRRSGGARHRSGGRGRGCRHAAGRLRAVPHPAGIPGAHPARAAAPRRSRTDASASRPRPGRQRSLTPDPLRTTDFEYELPPELIAQEPLTDRAGSRLLVLLRNDRRQGPADRRHAPQGRRAATPDQPAGGADPDRGIRAGGLASSPSCRRSSPPGDLLVLNTTKVRHARLLGKPIRRVRPPRSC